MLNFARLERGLWLPFFFGEADVRLSAMGQGCVKTYRNFGEQKISLPKRPTFNDRSSGKGQVTPENTQN